MTIPKRRFPLCAPSEWDVVLSPELAPLFVIEAAIIAAQRILAVHLDPDSFHAGGARYPPTREMIETMSSLRRLIHKHRRIAQAVADGPDRDVDHHEHANDSPF